MTRARWTAWTGVRLAAITALLLASCGDSGVPTMPDDRQCMNGGSTMTFRASAALSAAAGGRFEFHAGALDIPAGAMRFDTILTSTVQVTQCDFLRNLYEFGPSGLTFDPPARLELSYHAMMSRVDVNTVRLMVYDEARQEWEVAADLTLDAANHRFVGEIRHFSRYSLSANGQSFGAVR